MTGFDCRPARGRRNTLGALLLAAGLVCAVSSQAAAQDPAPPAQPPGQPAQPGQPPAQPAPAAPAAQPPAARRTRSCSTATRRCLPSSSSRTRPRTSKKSWPSCTRHSPTATSPSANSRRPAGNCTRAPMPGPNGTVIYVNFLSPALKGADYTISKILAEVFPQEVQQLFPLYRDAFAGLGRAELSLIHDFSAPPKPRSNRSSFGRVMKSGRQGCRSCSVRGCPS